MIATTKHLRDHVLRWNAVIIIAASTRRIITKPFLYSQHCCGIGTHRSRLCIQAASCLFCANAWLMTYVLQYTIYLVSVNVFVREGLCSLSSVANYLTLYIAVRKWSGLQICIVAMCDMQTCSVIMLPCVVVMGQGWVVLKHAAWVGSTSSTTTCTVPAWHSCVRITNSILNS